MKAFLIILLISDLIVLTLLGANYKYFSNSYIFYFIGFLFFIFGFYKIISEYKSLK